MINTIPITVTTTGSAGSATGTGETTRLVRGKVLGVFLNFHASAPATTDTTVRTKGTTAPSYNIVVVSNSATDVFLQPAGKPVDNTNTAITNSHAPIPVADYLEIALAGCDALTGAVVGHIVVEE